MIFSLFSLSVYFIFFVLQKSLILFLNVLSISVRKSDFSLSAATKILVILLEFVFDMIPPPCLLYHTFQNQNLINRKILNISKFEAKMQFLL